MLCAISHNKLPVFVVLFFAEEKNKRKTTKRATDINTDKTKLETLYLSTEKKQFECLRREEVEDIIH
jgi:hypothetical protein